jgi:hypothetical protein
MVVSTFSSSDAGPGPIARHDEAAPNAGEARHSRFSERSEIADIGSLQRVLGVAP